MRLPIFLLFLCVNTLLHAQKNTTFDPNYVHTILRQAQINAHHTHAAATIDTLETIFRWVADSIAYDMELYRKPEIRISSSLIDPLNDVWRTRKGVCEHYAVLLDAFCKEIGLESQVIIGYTTQTDVSEQARRSGSHAWNAVKEKGKWWLLDPTWASGYTTDSRDRYSAKWFKVPPETMILTHIPYDPLWQLMEYPYTKQEILAKINNPLYLIATDKSRLDFNHIIEQNKRLMVLEIEESRILRMQNYNDNNENAKQELNYALYNLKHEKMNMAINLLNISVNDYNQLITWRRNFYLSPKFSDEVLRKKTTNMLECWKNANNYLASLSFDDTSQNDHLLKSRAYAQNLSLHINAAEVMVNQYLKTWKYLRWITVFNGQNTVSIK